MPTTELNENDKCPECNDGTLKTPKDDDAFICDKCNLTIPAE